MVQRAQLISPCLLVLGLVACTGDADSAPDASPTSVSPATRPATPTTPATTDAPMPDEPAPSQTPSPPASAIDATPPPLTESIEDAEPDASAPPSATEPDGSVTSEPDAPAAAPQTGSQPVLNPRPPAEPAPAEEPPAFPDIELPKDPAVELLDELERNDEGLTGFRAKITYQTFDALLGRKETRTGEIIYHVDLADGRRRFASLFESVVIGPRKRNQQRQYVFDGRWLAEIDYDNKQFIKREVVAPGQEINPLKLGEGPFPLPIGQPREEVLRRFDAQLIERPKEGPLSRLADDVRGLRLTPRPGTREAEQFQSVDLFFDRETLLPVGSHVVEPPKDGESDTSIVLLRELERNPVLLEAELDTLRIVDPDPAEWRIDVRPWQGQ
ncbi:MAG: LolA family protein [Planctomycetota bacterium]|jgi:hypothetical protein